MPRLTDYAYLETCHQLRDLWRFAPDIYGHIRAQDQWQLHDYFQPSKDLSDAERLKHRYRVSVRRPALPQQAGRAKDKLEIAAISWLSRQQQSSRAQSVTTGGGRASIRVCGQVNPQIDAIDLLDVMLDIMDQPETNQSDVDERLGAIEDRLAND